MISAREKTLARLSLAALGVDIMVITFCIVALQKIIYGFYPFAPDLLILAIIPLVFILHFIIVEFIAGGNSIGRMSTGLLVRDELSGKAIRLGTAAKRSTKVFLCAGVPSINANKLPKYNKMQERCLYSDWVGSIPDEGVASGSPNASASISNQQIHHRQKRQLPIATGLKVITGPEKGKTAYFEKGKSFQKSGMYIVGRASAADLVLAKDTSVSSVHFRIFRKNNKVLIIDGKNSSQASKIGTFVNKALISNTKPSQLNSGDLISVGKTFLKVF